MAQVWEKRFNDNFRGLLKRSDSDRQVLLNRRPLKFEPKISETIRQKEKKNPAKILTVEAKTHTSHRTTEQIVGRRSSSRALVRVKSLKQSDMVVCPYQVLPKSKTTKFGEKAKFGKSMWNEIDLSDIEQDTMNGFEDSQKHNDESFLSIVAALNNV
ncbi:unnamed protein product [Blepharisma stoltei]|uniref:Uncharacterized protein n=1 Tax=Blepharisma stoltei TaxID=1481888 RepID=A0AAU9JXZ4_9CILI|nr:unnamed protein product [Blepharisma stoltei]